MSPTYEKKFLSLMAERQVETKAREQIDGGCLLCCQPTSERCHRRLVAEYLQKAWDGLDIIHL